MLFFDIIGEFFLAFFLIIISAIVGSIIIISFFMYFEENIERIQNFLHSIKEKKGK